MADFDCKKLVHTMQQAYKILKHENNSEKISKWIKRNSLNLRQLRRLLHTAKTVPDKFKYTAAIADLQGIQTKLRDLVKIGKGLQLQQSKNDRVKWQNLESAFNNNIQTGVITNIKNLDQVNFMKDSRELFKLKIKNALKRLDAVKVYAVLAAEYMKKSGNEEIVEIKYFNTKAESIFPTTDLNKLFMSGIEQPISKDMEEFQERDSGWSLQEILNLRIHVIKYNPIRGSTFIELPNYIKRKKACVNVKNFDNACFKWAILSALHSTHNSDRVSEYKKYENELNFTGIDFPVTSKQVPKFEKLNGISVNIFILNKRKNKFSVVPFRTTSHVKKIHVDLLLIQNYYFDEEEQYNSDDEDENTPRYHYVWIKNFSRLICSQTPKRKRRKYICKRCLNFFYSQSKLERHEQDCEKINKCRINLPAPTKNILEFKNFKNKEKVPFVVYADFECLLKPIQDSKAYQKHEAFSIGYYLKCSYDNSLSYYRCYRGSEPAKWFTQELLELAKNVENIFNNIIPMDQLTFEQKQAFRNSTQCHICQRPLNEKRTETDKKVRDHCHLTGRYRGAAHSSCNLDYQNSYTIPVIFHNFTGYDSHFLIRDLALDFPGKMDVIALNKECFISFVKHIDDSKISLKFIDSYRFLTSSLDKLASYLQELSILKNEFSKHMPLSEEQLKLLKRKGVFPYEYVDNEEKLDDTALPCKEAFHSSLNNCDVSEEDYKHAQKVWKLFNISNLGQYSDLYLKTDVLLLADIFENFRNSCIKTYELDPAHYYTTPGFTWDSMLKYTKIKLEQLTDIDKVMFIERGIRGGVSQCSNRYARANNKYMNSEYKSEEPTNYLMYYDANNLYGWAMIQPMPYGGFEWINDVDNIDFNISDDSPVGYFLEVDLEYPEHLHDMHKDLPFCPEHKKPPHSSQAKLLTTLDAKSRYVLHYRNLKQVLRNGLKLTKIHRILKFNQQAWLKPYIDLNSRMRQNARNDFEKNLYKLMNNAVFGKTMENVRKRVNVKLVRNWNKRYGAEALISKPEFHSHMIIDENLVLIELTKLEVTMNKPIYLGLSVLDLSKTLIYDFHYDYMKRKFGDACKLLYTDTDSLIYDINCEDIYKVMKEDIHHFDTSNYPIDNKFEIPRENNKIVGKMKDECNGEIMTEFVGLRSKMYSIRVKGKDYIKKVKGVKTEVVKNTITFDDYLHCLRNITTQSREQCTIRSREHNVFTEKQTKIALSPHDNKRYLIRGKTDTLPWGHYKIRKIDE